MWTPSRKAGEILYVSTSFSLNAENERADAGRDGQTRLARPNPQARFFLPLSTLAPENLAFSRDGAAEFVSRDQIQARTETKSSSADDEKHWQPYPVDPYFAISDDHTLGRI